MPGMTPNIPEDETTPGTGGTGGTESGTPKAPPRPRRRGRPSQMDKVEERLNEMFATIAVAQSGMGVVSGDNRHIVGGDVTAQLAPNLVAAWVKLAEENPRVRTVLLRMSETTAWGEVILATGALVYSQAQVYGAVPLTMPNPWVSIAVPPSEEVAGAYASPPPAAWTPPAADGPIAGRQPPQSGVDSESAAKAEAERQREAAERARLEFARNQQG